MKTYEEFIERLRERYDQFHCDITWGNDSSNIAISFHHSCGDGCCAWEERRFVASTDEEFGEFFFLNPTGQEVYMIPIDR